MSEDSLYITNRIRKVIEERRQFLADTIVHGAVPDFNTYLKLRAQLYELDNFGQTVVDIVKKIEGSRDE
jgi:hypothetical protein